MHERSSEAISRAGRRLLGPTVRGTRTGAARRAAFDNHGVDERVRALIDKVARHAWKVAAADVATAKTAGVSEDEIFELAVCAALGQATRQLNAARGALDAAMQSAAVPVTPAPHPDGKGTR